MRSSSIMMQLLTTLYARLLFPHPNWLYLCPTTSIPSFKIKRKIAVALPLIPNSCFWSLTRSLSLSLTLKLFSSIIVLNRSNSCTDREFPKKFLSYCTLPFQLKWIQCKTCGIFWCLVGIKDRETLAWLINQVLVFHSLQRMPIGYILDS